MSILLDALKKAEARKRQEAAQDGEPTAPAPLAATPVASEPPAPNGMSLEPMTEASSPPAVADASGETAPASPESTSPLELTPVEALDPAPPPSLTPLATGEPSVLPDSTPQIGATPESAARDDQSIEETTPSLGMPVEVKSHRDASTSPSAATSSSTSILPPPATASAAAISTPAPVVDAGTSRPAAPPFRAPADKPDPGPTTTYQPRSDKADPDKPAGEKPPADARPAAATDNDAARRQAQTVLAAPRVKAASGSRRRWVLASAGVGVLVLLGGGALFLRQLGVPPFGAPVSLVGNLPPPSSEPVVAPAVEAPPVASDPAAYTDPATASVAGASDAGADAAAAPITATAPVVTEPAPRVEPAATVARDLSSDPVIADTPAPPARSALATPVDELQLRREPLRVQRRSAPSQLNAAYAALQSGRLEDAEAAYRSTLDAQPGELDALLGLAVIAERRGDRASAERYYRRVLSQQPDHPQAMAALLSVNGPPQGEDEHRLRQSLVEHPDSAVLHAAMGQRMATQQRWADAQAAYFEAVAREPGNADHLYNLAVALDHLQQPRVAADYYRRALAQPDPSSRFDRQAAMQRLAALDAAGASR